MCVDAAMFDFHRFYLDLIRLDVVLPVLCDYQLLINSVDVVPFELDTFPVGTLLSAYDVFGFSFQLSALCCMAFVL